MYPRPQSYAQEQDHEVSEVIKAHKTLFLLFVKQIHPVRVDLTQKNEKVDANADVEPSCKDDMKRTVELVVNNAYHR